jgi:hypothetical protein
MNIRNLSVRLARIDVGDARCIEDLLKALNDPAETESPVLPAGTDFNP